MSESKTYQTYQSRTKRAMWLRKNGLADLDDDSIRKLVRGQVQGVNETGLEALERVYFRRLDNRIAEVGRHADHAEYRRHLTAVLSSLPTWVKRRATAAEISVLRGSCNFTTSKAPAENVIEVYLYRQLHLGQQHDKDIRDVVDKHKLPTRFMRRAMREASHD